MMESDRSATTLRDELVRRFRVDPARVRVVRAPYRICPLGAHIDHQLGPVTALALDRGVMLAYVPSATRTVEVDSLDFPGRVRFALDDIPSKEPGAWGNYPRGAALALKSRHRLESGLHGVVSGRLHGGGVSSSAATGVAFLLALEDVNGLRLDPLDNIRLDQEIENGYLGLRNGILDQAAVLLSKQGHLTCVDCGSGQFERVPAAPQMPPFTILLAFSGLRRSLVGTDYNLRVAECAEAARTLLDAAGRGGLSHVLGNVTSEEYAEHRHLLKGAPARRAEHFFTEAERVRLGIDAWRRGDLATLGALMNISGESSIHNYECGSPPLIALVETLKGLDGVLGCRFSGAGFRGCCVALVEPARAESIAAQLREQYAGRFPELARDAAVVFCGSHDGASFVEGTSLT